MERVLVVGCGGTGKTTASRHLGALLDLPVTHLDHVYWRPGWTPLPTEELRRRVADLVAQPRWVLDGNYGGTADLRFPRADTIVFLDFPRRVCLAGVAGRTARGWGRPVQAPGCPERLDPEFLRYVWSWPRAGRRRLLKRIDRFGHGAALVRLRSRAELRGFLAGIAASAPPR